MRRILWLSCVRSACVCVACACLACACFASIDEGLIRHGPADGGSDGSADAASDAMDASSAGDAAPYDGVLCGTGTCQPPAIVCCTGSFGDPDYRHGHCSARDDCNTGDFFACVSPADCTYQGAAGPRCCVVRDRQGAFTRTECAATCDQEDLCGAACPSDRTCRASLQFPVLLECAR